MMCLLLAFQKEVQSRPNNKGYNEKVPLFLWGTYERIRLSERFDKKIEEAVSWLYRFKERRKLHTRNTRSYNFLR